MKASELCLGNVTDKGIVTAIEYGRICCDDHDWDEEDVNPIPLTEEWLVKLGFVKKDYDFELGYLKYDRVESDYGCEYIKSNFWIVPNGDDDYYRIPIELAFVHQLQNLNHALTGEELNLK